MTDSTKLTDPETVRQKVHAGYGEIAQQGSERRGGSKGCCGAPPSDTERLARMVGYSAEELAALPEGANMGLSCGNPNALASLQPREIVLDLGSGGGFDVFIAGRKVGAAGRAIGVDMTAEMLAMMHGVSREGSRSNTSHAIRAKVKRSITPSPAR